MALLEGAALQPLPKPVNDHFDIRQKRVDALGGAIGLQGTLKITFANLDHAKPLQRAKMARL